MAAYTTIDDPELFFQVKLWSGNSTTDTAITLDGDEDMQPDLVWSKVRTTTYEQQVCDSVRGATKIINPNATSAEQTVADSLLSFTSDGFTMGSGGDWNGSGQTYVAWAWKESATSGVDIVLYTGTGSTHNENHSLSALPDMIIVKRRDSTSDWFIYHRQGTGVGYGIKLNTDAAKTGSWNWDANSTTSTFQINGGAQTPINVSDATYIAYLFATKQGFSKFGTYEGNGNADGTFIYTGFRPAFVMTKSIDSTSSWHMFDNKREGYNVDNDALVAEATTAEATTDMIDLLSNGFKCRIATDPNVSETYLYMAFAEAPFVNSEGAPCNAR